MVEWIIERLLHMPHWVYVSVIWIGWISIWSSGLMFLAAAWLYFVRADPLSPKQEDTIPDMTGQHLGMSFLIADLHGASGEHEPKAGDVLIFLDICSMGVVVNRDRRGRFTGQRWAQLSDPNERLYDKFEIQFNDDVLEEPDANLGIGSFGRKTIARYQLRRCGIQDRTWVVTE